MRQVTSDTTHIVGAIARDGRVSKNWNFTRKNVYCTKKVKQGGQNFSLLLSCHLKLLLKKYKKCNILFALLIIDIKK